MVPDSKPASSRASKRDEILEKASRLFYTQGFGATGIKQIIDEAGLAKGTFYGHFESKEALGVAWLERQNRVSGNWFSRVLDRYTEPSDKILATFEFLDEWQLQEEYRGCAFINTAAETPDWTSAMRKVIFQNKHSVRKVFEDLAEDHFSARGFASERGRRLGTALYLLFEGALVDVEIEKDPWPIQSGREGAREILALKKV